MQYIKRNGTSSVIYRLSKVSSYATPSFIFNLENQNTRVNTIFTSTDVSLVPYSYNEYQWNNGTQSNSTFNLPEGEYDVAIYENPFGLTQITASSSLLYKDEIKVVDYSTASNTNYFNSYTQSSSDDINYFE